MSNNEQSCYERALMAEVKAERSARGWTQEAVARKAGLPLVSYQRYESGERHPAIPQVAAIAEALGMRTSELMSRAEYRLARHPADFRASS